MAIFKILSVLHQNKALHNFHKKGQRSIVENNIGLEYAQSTMMASLLFPVLARVAVDMIKAISDIMQTHPQSWRSLLDSHASYGILHHMGNAWVSPSVSHRLGKCNKTI